MTKTVTTRKARAPLPNREDAARRRQVSPDATSGDGSTPSGNVYWPRSAYQEAWAIAMEASQTSDAVD